MIKNIKIIKFILDKYENLFYINVKILTKFMLNPKKIISDATIERLPLYLSCLQDIKNNEIEEISSRELAEILNIKTSQLRQDFHNFGGFGKAGHKYNVSIILNKLNNIIGLESPHHMAIIGAGHLGQALANYINFEKRDFIVKGIFDINPKVIGLIINEIEVQDIDKLYETVKKENISIGIITVPAKVSQHVADLLVKNEVKAIWDFAPTNLKLPEDVAFRHEHLSKGLLTLSYKIKEKEMISENK